MDAFEKVFSDYVGLKHSVALTSDTGAMHLALRDIGVGPDPQRNGLRPPATARHERAGISQGSDEVFGSSLTFIGSVSPVTFLGGIPVFIDSDRETWNMDPDFLSEELQACKQRGHLRKAVIPTDLCGQCADYYRYC